MRIRRSFLSVALTLAGSLPALAQVVPVGDEISVTPGTGRQHQPVVALVRDGSLLAWADEFQGAMARRYDAAGSARGDAFVLVANDPLPSTPFFHLIVHEAHDPTLAVRPDGSFLLAWTDQKLNHSGGIL